MKNYITKKILTSFAALALLMAVSIMPGLASAAGASISLTASKSTVANGGSVVIAIYMNGGGNPVNAVEADFTYQASKLQYVGISYSGSAFSINAPNNGGGNGLVTIGNGTTSPVSGSGLVATVTFRALVGSGSAAFGVAGSSSLVNANDNSAVAYGTSDTSINFGASAATPASVAAPAAPAAPKDTTPPIITAVKVKDLTPFSATISWTTNEPSDSAVDYGLDTTYGLSTSASPLVTAHAVTLNSTFLTPQTTFHYRVKSTDGSGNIAAGTDQTLQLPGVPVTIIVRGAGGKPQVGASVTLDGATGTTDSKGSVTLPSSLGNKKITTTYAGVTVQKPITVAKTAKPLPPYQLDLSKQPLNRWMLVSIGLGVAVLTLLAIDAVLFGSRLFGRLAGLRFASSGPRHDLGPAPAVTAVSAPAEPAELPLDITLAPEAGADEDTSPSRDKPVDEIVDEMLAMTEPLPTASELHSPITSIDDIQLAQPAAAASPKKKPKTRKVKTAPKLPK